MSEVLPVPIYGGNAPLKPYGKYLLKTSLSEYFWDRLQQMQKNERITLTVMISSEHVVQDYAVASLSLKLSPK